MNNNIIINMFGNNINNINGKWQKILRCYRLLIFILKQS